MLVTLGLAVAVLALGNGLLYIEKKRNGNGKGFFGSKRKVSDEDFNGFSLLGKKNGVDSYFKNQYYLEKRMGLINTRLAKLEQYLTNGNGHSNGNGNGQANDYSLDKKMDRLEEFKREAEIEIRAMRDHLTEKDGVFKKKMKKEDKKLDKRIHSLVFNLNNGKKKKN